jgi:cytochrome c-type biogenesis protein CcmH
MQWRRSAWFEARRSRGEHFTMREGIAESTTATMPLHKPSHPEALDRPAIEPRRTHGRNSWLAAAVVGVALLTLAPALAVQPDEMLKDPALEARARSLSAELRCMVCQNQSIDDSDAPLARDLRILLRERIAAGDSDAQVTDFLVARYGEFILLKPRFNAHTLLLWLLPPAVLVVGGLVMFAASRRRAQPPAAELNADEEKRLSDLVSRRD